LHLKNIPTFVACGAAMLSFGCAQLSTEESVELRRSQYNVQLTSFAVDDQPQVAPVEMTDTAQAELEAAATPPAVGEEETPAEPEAVVMTTTQAVLDILVTTEADEGLPGLTVELEQVGANGAVKMERQLWLDVSRVVRGSGAQITHVVEDVDYEEGDGFAVSIRSPVPPGERDVYREFAANDSGGTGY
jgi:predicted PhzF superfamily epimerase YddE/YHI9